MKIKVEFMSPKKERDPRGRKPIKKAERKKIVDGSYKHPADIRKLGGIYAVRTILSKAFDEALEKVKD